MKIKAYAKVNIFLKIVGLRGNYHLISSRFFLLRNLYDEIEFIKKDEKSDTFVLHGNFGCPLEKNTIYKAYRALYEYTGSKKLKEFFQTHLVTVKKRIPEFAGLGGGSSNGASFILLANKVVNLGLKRETLAKISSTVGSDLPFFIYEFNSANVAGVGEMVTKFADSAPKIVTKTPNIKCDTAKVYGEFRKNYVSQIDKNAKTAQKLSNLNTQEILNRFDAQTLNDLLLPAQNLYPQLKEHQQNGWYFSGSGSTFFKMERS